MSGDEALKHLRAGRPQAAAERLERELAERPGDARAWFLLGASHHALNRLEAAANAFARSVQLDPREPQAHLALVTVLRAAGNKQAARAAASAALAAIPENARLHYAAALAADELGEIVEALAHYERALQIDPVFEDALHNRGLLLLRIGWIREALNNQRHYTRQFPNSARAYGVLADTLLAGGEFEQALLALNSYQVLAPGEVSVPIRRGVALAGLRRYEDARTAFARAQSDDPEGVARFIARIAPGSDLRFMFSPENLFLWQGWLAQGRCDWGWWSASVSELRRLSRGSDATIEPAIAFMSLHVPLSDVERAAVARHITAAIESNVVPLELRAPRRQGPVRIGIISPDLRDHVVGRLLLPLFELLDRKRFQLYAYSLLAGREDGLRASLRNAADKFRDLDAYADDAAAATIADDDVDILVDVSGHTTGSRFSILARRPARVQALFLGYAGTTGSSRIDYIIVDDIVAPDPNGCSESPICLPHTYVLYDFRQAVPEVGLSRADYGLPNDAIVFCAFHKPEKISPDAMLLWTRILRQMKRSVLWLGSCPTSAQQNLRHEAAMHGIAPDRLIFAPFEQSPRYLARQRLGDLMLDAIHHNAISSACDALSVGLPILTIRGSTMASRSCESILRALDLPELVSRDKETYVAQAVRLAAEPTELARIRSKILERSAPLFDTAGRVRELEDAFQEMWDRYRRKAGA